MEQCIPCSFCVRRALLLTVDLGTENGPELSQIQKIGTGWCTLDRKPNRHSRPGSFCHFAVLVLTPSQPSLPRHFVPPRHLSPCLPSSLSYLCSLCLTYVHLPTNTPPWKARDDSSLAAPVQPAQKALPDAHAGNAAAKCPLLLSTPTSTTTVRRTTGTMTICKFPGGMFLSSFLQCIAEFPFFCILPSCRPCVLVLSSGCRNFAAPQCPSCCSIHCEGELARIVCGRRLCAFASGAHPGVVGQYGVSAEVGSQRLKHELLTDASGHMSTRVDHLVCYRFTLHVCPC